MEEIISLKRIFHKKIMGEKFPKQIIYDNLVYKYSRKYDDYIFKQEDGYPLGLIKEIFRIEDQDPLEKYNEILLTIKKW